MYSEKEIRISWSTLCVRSLLIVGLLTGMLFVTGCDNRPFKAKYTSANSVNINYQGKTYTLKRFGPKSKTPFQYSFESDGDLDLVINGREYEVDSPYDRDRKKKTTKKKTPVEKKKTTGKTTSKTTSKTSQTK